MARIYLAQAMVVGAEVVLPGQQLGEREEMVAHRAGEEVRAEEVTAARVESEAQAPSAR